MVHKLSIRVDCGRSLVETHERANINTYLKAVKKLNVCLIRDNYGNFFLIQVQINSEIQKKIFLRKKWIDKEWKNINEENNVCRKSDHCI